MPNYDGRYELRFIYSTSPIGFITLFHRLTMDVALTAEPAVGEPLANILTVDRIGENLPLSEFILTLADSHLKKLFHANTTISTCELWKYPETGTDGVFVGSRPLGVVGTALGAPAPAAQGTITFRTYKGGIARVQVMEGALNGNIFTGFPTGNVAVDDLEVFLTSSDCPVVGRDNSYLLVGNRYSTCENEKLWRKRFRP